MPSGDDPVQKSQEFFGMFLKAKEFTEELLKENERLRYKIASLQSAPQDAAPVEGDEQTPGTPESVPPPGAAVAAARDRGGGASFVALGMTFSPTNSLPG